MSAVIIPSSKLLAVQKICAVMVCKGCKIALPSERSAKDHLINMHSVDPNAAKEYARKCDKAADAVRAIPNPFRDTYLHAPDQAPESDQHVAFLRPLDGITISPGFKCTRCTACYISEKGVRSHLVTKHPLVDAHAEWQRIALNGKIKLQTVFGGNKTKYFPVSSSLTSGHVLSVADNSPSHLAEGLVQSAATSEPVLSSLGMSIASPGHESAIHLFFEEMEQVLRTDQTSEDLPLPHVNPYLAGTEFHVQLREAGYDMARAAQYSAISRDFTNVEQLAARDVTDYFVRTRQIAQDVSPAVLHDVNMVGNKEFNVVSDASAKKYSQHFSRLVVCAFRVRHLPFVPKEILKYLEEYWTILQRGAQNTTSHKRLGLLHNLLRILCLFRLSKAESPKKLFIYHFLMFSSVVRNNRNQHDVYRWAQAKEMTHLLAAILYGASSCALFHIHRLGLRVNALRNKSFNTETRLEREKIDGGMDDTLLALDESQNSPAAFVRKTLTLARSISAAEDVTFLFDTCNEHHLCGVVDNIHISMKALGKIISSSHRQLDSSFTSLLYGASLPSNFFSNLSAIKDSLQNTQSGYSFLSQGFAQQSAKKYATWLFRTITRDRPAGKAAFTPTESDISSGNVVKVFGQLLGREAVEKWLAMVQKVQNILLVCTHLSSGSPSRATELETLKLFNTDFAPRNFYVSQGRAAIVTRYSKTRSLTGLDKVIPRFPDPGTSKHFLTYLLLFRTLETAFVEALYGTSTMKSHLQALFVERGNNYKAPRIRDIICHAFHTHDLPIEFNHYRHFTAGITPAVTELSPRLQRNELIADATAIAHLQAGHSTAIAEHNYARQSSILPSLTSSALTKYKLFSFEWHKCLGLTEQNTLVSDNVLRSSPNTPHALVLQQSLSKSISSTISKSIKKEFKESPCFSSSVKRGYDDDCSHSVIKRPRTTSILFPPPFRVEENLRTYLPFLRAFIGDPSAMFRSDTQLQSIAAIKSAAHNVLLIMPTGAGKTISFLLPAYLEGPDSTTVIFVPLVALVNEIVDKCKKLNFSVATWSSRQTVAQVYVISPDHTRRDIESFLRGLQSTGRLRRIVFDEAHLLLLWSSFRPSFRRLPYTLQSGSDPVQFVLCTATLPPMYRERLLRMLYLPSAVLYEQSTIRLNLKYQVVDTSTNSLKPSNGCFPNPEQVVTRELCHQVLSISSDLLREHGGRILVFCLYRKQVEETCEHLKSFLRGKLGTAIPVRAYHGAMQSQQLDQCYQFWKQNDANIKIVVCTSAFGTGLDVPNVRAVLHIGGSNGLLEYAQETGRAGRDGKKALCILIYNRTLADHHTDLVTKSPNHSSSSADDDEEDKRQEWFLMNQYMTQTTSCRRRFIFRHIDGKSPQVCALDINAQNCEICDALSSISTGNSSSCGSNVLSPIMPQLSPPAPSSQPSSPKQPEFIPETPDQSPFRHGSPTLQNPAQNPSQSPVITSFSPQPDPLSEFRIAAHGLKGICVPCFVLEKAKRWGKHACYNMKTRCKRCFHLGHSSTHCETFDPFKQNYCYGCSLSQVMGQNIHKQGEFGASCFMRVTRNLAWMLWANDLHTNDYFTSALCSPGQATTLKNLLQTSSDIKSFFDEWLNSDLEGVPNLVRLILWWLPKQSLN